MADEPTEDSPPLAGEQLSIEYVPLAKARDWDWKDNPKKHDIGNLINSISRYGFKDPPKYEPELDGFGHGNGRTEALAKMRDNGLEPPRGILTDEDGKWHVPVLFGVDSVSKAVAEAYAVDHNNLTMAGGDFNAEDLASMWEGSDYVALLERISGDERPQTVTEDDIAELSANLNAPDHEEWSDAFDGVADGERGEIRERRFMVHVEHVDVVDRAVEDAKDRNDFSGSPNENSNGNAIHAICREYLRTNGDS